MRAMMLAVLIMGAVMAVPAEACNTHGYVAAVTLNQLFDDVDGLDNIDIWDNEEGDIDGTKLDGTAGTGNVTFNGGEVSGYITDPGSWDSKHDYHISYIDSDGTRKVKDYTYGTASVNAAIDFLEGLLEDQQDDNSFDG